MNEKYGIELELLTSAFNKQVEKVKKTAESIKTAFDPNDVSGMKINGSLQKEISGISREFQKLSGKKISLGNAVELQNYKTKLQSIGKEFKRIENNSKGLFKAYNTEAIQQVVNGYGQVEKKVEKTKNEVKELNQEVKKTTLINNGVNQLVKGIDKATSRIKRFALSLFSIRSIYALVSKASSAYLSQDTQLANKLQAVWVGLGALLEPAISKIANLMLKAVKYVNIFVKALTGVDLLAKATAKSLSGTSKSANKLNKSLAGFDELTNIDTTSDTTSSGIDTNWADAFNDVQVNENVATTIENIGKRIKSAWDWFTQNWKIITVGAIGVAAGVTLLHFAFNKLTKKDIGTGLSDLFSKLGTATEIIAVLGGLSLVIGQVSNLISVFAESGLSLSDVAILLGSVLGELAIAFTIIAGATKLMDWKGIAGATVILAGFALIINQVSNLLKVFSDTGLTVGDVAGLMASIFGTLVVLMGAIALIGPAMTAGLVPFSVVVLGISALLLVMAETIPTILEACGKFINDIAPSIKSILETIGKSIENIIYAIGTVLPPIINSVGNVFEKIFSGISQVILSVGAVIVSIMNTAKDLITTVLSSILGFINDLGPAINNFVDNAIIAVTKLINFLISGVEYLVNTLVIGGVNKIISAINKIGDYVGFTIPTVNRMSIPRFVPQLAVGTNYVPEDQLAYIHQGEAVIPKKFNSQEYFGSGNQETNNLLEQVIEAINNIEIAPYTTIKDVGQASIDFINSKTRQYGRSVI